MRSEGVECEGMVRGCKGGGAVTGGRMGVEGEGSRGSPPHWCWRRLSAVWLVKTTAAAAKCLPEEREWSGEVSTID